MAVVDANASDTWQSYERCFRLNTLLDFKKFIEKTLSHRDAAFHTEATLAAKDFVCSMESSKGIDACMDAGNAKRIAENKKILTSMVKTVLFCASSNIPLRGHSADKG